MHGYALRNKRLKVFPQDFMTPFCDKFGKGLENWADKLDIPIQKERSINFYFLCLKGVLDFGFELLILFFFELLIVNFVLLVSFQGLQVWPFTYHKHHTFCHIQQHTEKTKQLRDHILPSCPTIIFWPGIHPKRRLDVFICWNRVRIFQNPILQVSH